MKQNYKIFSFIIALKRYKRNSFVLNTPKYILAKKLNISVNTYSKYLQEAIELGWISKESNGYRIIKFREIVIDQYSELELFFDKHRILASKSLDFKEIEQQINELLIIDNIIKPQQRKINQKSLIELFERFSNNGTDKKVKDEWYELPYKTRLRIVQAYKKKCVQDQKNNSQQYRKDVITSVRHASKKLSISKYKASKVMNGARNFDRTILSSWVKGVSFIKMEQLKIQFPNATIIPFMKFDKIKVCHGSILYLK